MGTASTVKVLRNIAGALTEETTLITSGGSGDANKVVALNASGILDASIVNSKATSAGAGDAGKLAALNASGLLDSTIVNSTTISSGAASAAKIVALNASGLLDSTIINSTVVSAGVGSAAKVVTLDATGHIDITVIPTGFVAEVQSVLTSEALTAGQWVNVYNNAGTANARKADSSVAGKHSMGFVNAGFASGVIATVYLEGANAFVTGQIPGDVFLSTAGTGSSTPPTASGSVVQVTGVATSATSVNFKYNRPLTLA